MKNRSVEFNEPQFRRRRCARRADRAHTTAPPSSFPTRGSCTARPVSHSHCCDPNSPDESAIAPVIDKRPELHRKNAVPVNVLVHFPVREKISSPQRRRALPAIVVPACAAQPQVVVALDAQAGTARRKAHHQTLRPRAPAPASRSRRPSPAETSAPSASRAPFRMIPSRFANSRPTRPSTDPSTVNRCSGNTQQRSIDAPPVKSELPSVKNDLPAGRRFQRQIPKRPIRDFDSRAPAPSAVHHRAQLRAASNTPHVQIAQRRTRRQKKYSSNSSFRCAHRNKCSQSILRLMQQRHRAIHISAPLLRIPSQQRRHVYRLHVRDCRPADKPSRTAVRSATTARPSHHGVAPQVAFRHVQRRIVISVARRRQLHAPVRIDAQIVEPRFRAEQRIVRQNLRRVEIRSRFAAAQDRVSAGGAPKRFAIAASRSRSNISAPLPDCRRENKACQEIPACSYLADRASTPRAILASPRAYLSACSRRPRAPPETAPRCGVLR